MEPTEQPQHQPEPAPAPAAPRDAQAIRDDLLKATNELLDYGNGVEWGKRDELIEKRQALYAELELAKKPKTSEPPKVEQKKPEAEPQVKPEQKQALEPGKPAFELAVPEMLTPSQKEIAAGYAQDVAVIATEQGIPQEEAAVIYETALDVATTIMPNGEEPNLANIDECMTVMNNRWGADATKELVADANKAVARLGAHVREWLDTPNEFGERIGNSPAAIYALAAWQRGYTRMSPEKAASEVARLRGLKQYQEGHKLTVDHVNLLAKIAARGKSNEMAMPMRQAPVAPSKVQQRIDAIRRDPNYYGGDNRLRAVLVAEMADLHRQLHGKEA